MHEHFKTEQWLPLPRAVVFAFFANPLNLPPLMPDWQRARIVEATLVPPPPRPEHLPELPGIAAGSGTQLLITARAAPGLPLRTSWLALIEDFGWNDHFCDVQLKGPFAYWRHCHSVRDEVRNGRLGTVVRDSVRYALPLTPLSRVATPIGKLAMSAMFRYRQRRATTLVSEYAAKLASTATKG